jgi:hypothetical protein
MAETLRYVQGDMNARRKTKGIRPKVKRDICQTFIAPYALHLVPIYLSF